MGPKAPLGDCTDALIPPEIKSALMLIGRGHMRAVRTDNSARGNTTQVVYYLLPSGTDEDQPDRVPEGATFWVKKSKALDSESGGSVWPGRSAGAALGGEQSAQALVVAPLDQGGANPPVRCRPFSHLPRLTPNQASLSPIPTLTSLLFCSHKLCEL
jgi:hypothetical protein